MLHPPAGSLPRSASLSGYVVEAPGVQGLRPLVSRVLRFEGSEHPDLQLHASLPLISLHPVLRLSMLTCATLSTTTPQL